MKKIILLIVLIVSTTCVQADSSDTATTTSQTPTEQINSINSVLTEIQKTVALINGGVAKTQQSNTAAKKTCNECTLSKFERFLLLFPFVISILLIFWVLYRLRQEKYSLAVALCYNPFLSSSSSIDKLKEMDPSKIYLYNHPSSTRLIAFISGLVSVIIAFSISMISCQRIICGGDIPDFSNLLSVFVGLGIGVIPYGINRFTQKEKPQPPIPPGGGEIPPAPAPAPAQ